MVIDKYEGVRVRDLGDHVTEVRLNRPERRNSLTMAVLEQISRALDDAVSTGARTIVLSGEGTSFCAGADLFSVHNPDHGERNQVGLGSARLWEQIGALEVPVIAAVQGHAITGGLHLAVCCDLIVAAEDAVFQDTHAKFGLVPGSGEPQRIARRIGIMAAREMLLSSRRYSAEELKSLGLVSHVVPAVDLLDTAVGLARSIALNNARAVGYIKRMLNNGLGRPYGEAQWDDYLLNWNGQLNMGIDDDARERLRAFRERTGAPEGEEQ